MPKGPKGEKRPADVIGGAVKSLKIVTGEISEELEDEPKGRAGGSWAVKPELKKLSKKQRQEIARKAAQARWSKPD